MTFNDLFLRQTSMFHNVLKVRAKFATVTDRNNNNFPLLSRTENSLSLTISPETMAELVGFLPEDTKDYIDLLMAPIFTGEELSPEEYVDVIRGLYGPSVAENLLSSIINISFIAEKNITDIELFPEDLGVISKQGKKASFQIPLHKILSNSKKSEICIWW